MTTPTRLRAGLRRAGLAFALLALAPAIIEEHAIHTTMTVVTAEQGMLALNVRAFADDFSASVARHAGHRPPADTSAVPAEVLAYMRAHLSVRDPAGAALALQPCGLRRASELYWICVRVAVPRGMAGTVIENQLLTELHADQVNIVQVESGAGRQTMLFTKTSRPAAITAGR